VSDLEKIDVPYFIQLKSNSDSRGEIYFSEYGELPFEPVRFFFLRPGSLLSARGEHGHHTCWQLIFPVDDSIIIISGPEGKESQFNLPLGSALVIPPKNWCKVLFSSKNSVAVILASHEYDPEDYFYSQPKL